jgi:hypothetical protein
MPRAPRLDVPDVLHHVMARGLERQPIFRDDQDDDGVFRKEGDIAVFFRVIEVLQDGFLKLKGTRLLKRGKACYEPNFPATFPKTV